MPNYANRFPKFRTVSKGRVFSDGFDRADGSVGNSWEFEGSEEPLISSNRVLFDSILDSVSSGIRRTLFSNASNLPKSLSLRFSLSLQSKQPTGTPKVSVLFSDSAKTFLVELEDDDPGSPMWTETKKVSLYRFYGGYKTLVADFTRDIPNDTYVKVLYDNSAVSFTYSVRGIFQSPIQVPLGISITENTEVGFYAESCSFYLDDVFCSTHEAIYVYGLSPSWKVNSNIGLTPSSTFYKNTYVPSKGTVRIDTSEFPVDTITPGISVEITNPSGDSFTYVLEGGDALAPYTFTPVGNAFGVQKCGNTPVASFKHRLPVVFVDPDKGNPKILTYVTGNDVVRFPVVANESGSISIYLDRGEAVDFFETRSISANVPEVFEVSTLDIHPNVSIRVLAVFSR